MNDRTEPTDPTMEPTTEPTVEPTGRRLFLLSTMDLGLGVGLLAAPRVLAASPAPAGIPPGRPGEFNFLAGEWKISHRMRKGDRFDEFVGEASCYTLLGGAASVEELRIPARDFFGMGLRLLDREQKIWNDYWVNAKSGALGASGVPGGFKDGVGTFISEEEQAGKKLLFRGVWDRITASSHRWRQGVSKDGGKTWDDTWIMEWTRAARPGPR